MEWQLLTVLHMFLRIDGFNLTSKSEQNNGNIKHAVYKADQGINYSDAEMYCESRHLHLARLYPQDDPDLKLPDDPAWVSGRILNHTVWEEGILTKNVTQASKQICYSLSVGDERVQETNGNCTRKLQFTLCRKNDYACRDLGGSDGFIHMGKCYKCLQHDISNWFHARKSCSADNGDWKFAYHQGLANSDNFTQHVHNITNETDVEIWLSKANNIWVGDKRRGMNIPFHTPSPTEIPKNGMCRCKNSTNAQDECTKKCEDKAYYFICKGKDNDDNTEHISMGEYNGTDANANNVDMGEYNGTDANANNVDMGEDNGTDANANNVDMAKILLGILWILPLTGVLLLYIYRKRISHTFHGIRTRLQKTEQPREIEMLARPLPGVPPTCEYDEDLYDNRAVEMRQHDNNWTVRYSATPRKLDSISEAKSTSPSDMEYHDITDVDESRLETSPLRDPQTYLDTNKTPPNRMGRNNDASSTEILYEDPEMNGPTIDGTVNNRHNTLIENPSNGSLVIYEDPPETFTDEPLKPSGDPSQNTHQWADMRLDAAHTVLHTYETTHEDHTSLKSPTHPGRSTFEMLALPGSFETDTVTCSADYCSGRDDAGRSSLQTTDGGDPGVIVDNLTYIPFTADETDAAAKPVLDQLDQNNTALHGKGGSNEEIIIDNAHYEPFSVQQNMIENQHSSFPSDNRHQGNSDVDVMLDNNAYVPFVSQSEGDSDQFDNTRRVLEQADILGARPCSTECGKWDKTNAISTTGGNNHDADDNYDNGSTDSDDGGDDSGDSNKELSPVLFDSPLYADSKTNPQFHEPVYELARSVTTD